LLWTDIDLDAQVIRLQKHKTKRATKKPRIIHLHPVILKLLIVIRRYGQAGEHVFLNHRKKPWSRRTLSQRVRRIRMAAGIPHDAKLYGIRHRFAVRAIVNGCDIKTLSALLGHSTTRMTEHYLSAFDKQHSHLADAMLKVNASRPPADARRPAS
jgi:integrase